MKAQNTHALLVRTLTQAQAALPDATVAERYNLSRTLVANIERALETPATPIAQLLCLCREVRHVLPAAWTVLGLERPEAVLNLVQQTIEETEAFIAQEGLAGYYDLSEFVYIREEEPPIGAFTVEAHGCEIAVHPRSPRRPGTKAPLQFHVRPLENACAGEPAQQ